MTLKIFSISNLINFVASQNEKDKIIKNTTSIINLNEKIYFNNNVMLKELINENSVLFNQIMKGQKCINQIDEQLNGICNIINEIHSDNKIMFNYFNNIIKGLINHKNRIFLAINNRKIIQENNIQKIKKITIKQQLIIKRIGDLKWKLSNFN